MNIPYLNLIIPLHWWKTELQDHYQDHIGPASIVIVTATLVSYVWGKYTAIGLLTVAVLTYPLSHKQIRYFMFLEAYGTAQAVACVTIPILCSKVPVLSAWSMPLHVALAYSILNREWRLCQSSCNTSQEIHRLTQLNTQLRDQVSSLGVNGKKLEEALSSLMAEVKQLHANSSTSDQLDQQKDQIEIQVDFDFKALNEKIERLAALCQTAAQTNGLAEQLGQIDTNHQMLEHLTRNCELRNQELQKLTEQITKIKKDLDEVLQKIIQKEVDTQTGLSMVMSWLTAIVEQKAL